MSDFTLDFYLSMKHIYILKYCLNMIVIFNAYDYPIDTNLLVEVNQAILACSF